MIVLLLAVETHSIHLFFTSAAVVAIIQSPVATSSAAVAEAALWAVTNLAVDAEIRAKLGSAGVCEGAWIRRWVGSWLGGSMDG